MRERQGLFASVGPLCPADNETGRPERGGPLVFRSQAAGTEAGKKTRAREDTENILPGPLGAVVCSRQSPGFCLSISAGGHLPRSGPGGGMFLRRGRVLRFLA